RPQGRTGRWSGPSRSQVRWRLGGGDVQAALELARARPAALAALAGDGAGRAADRAVALVVQRVVREVVLGDVAPHVPLRPARQRRVLPEAVAQVPAHLGRARAQLG